MLALARTYHLPGVVLTDIRHFVLVPLILRNVQQPRNIFLIQDVCDT